MHVQTKIKKWGNSLALRLSGPMVLLPHFKENMLVDVRVTESGLEIKPVVLKKQKKLPFSEADLLEGLTAKHAHADTLVIPTKKELGKE